MTELKNCPFCDSKAKWCGEDEADPDDNHLCHHIRCTNPACAADFDFNTDGVGLLPDDVDDMTAEQCMQPFREECAKRFNHRG